jgi:phosphonate transport system ATP-binding protein
LRIETAIPEAIGRMEPAIDVAHLTKTFGASRGGTGQKALDDASLKIMPGEMVALIGASGSGKSTLLRHIAGLVASDADPRCSVAVHGGCLQAAGSAARDIRRRRRDISVVFQQFNLVDRLPVLTNVLVGMLGRVPLWRSLPGIFTTAEKQSAFRALSRVGIADLVCQRASTLSGGQQQRAAIARALVQRARIILADEPIASLDPGRLVRQCLGGPGGRPRRGRGLRARRRPRRGAGLLLAPHRP